MSMSTASQAAEESRSPEKENESHVAKPASEPSGGEEPEMKKSDYWGPVPKTQHKEDWTPWKWTCFSVSTL